MPGSMDGIALAKILRRLRPGLRVIVASGQLPEECCESTIDMFFRKPYDLTLVAEFIKTLLASRD